MANTGLQTFQLNLPLGSIEAYLNYVNQIPMLSKEDELAYALKLQSENDLSAARALILPHLRYVVRIAKNYLGYGLPLNDLVQEGNIGLMKAVKRFNPAMGVRLVTFAMHWIKAEIHEYVLRNWRIVKIATTKAQRKLFFNLKSLKKNLGWFSEQEINEVAKDLKVKPETVREMEMRMHASDCSFDISSSEDDDHRDFTPVKYLEDHTFNPARAYEQNSGAAQANHALYEALQKLDSRSQEILQTRWLNENKSTLQDLATKYGVSAERIRQLEKMALDKLKLALA